MKFESTFRVKQCDIMEEMNVYFSLGLVTLLFLSSQAMSDPPLLQLCHVGEARSKHADINLNTSLLVGTNGSCSCHFNLSKSSALEMSFENVTSPKCETNVTLSDPDFKTTCNNSYIQYMPCSKSFVGGSWIHVKTIKSFTHPMSGTIKLRTKNHSNILLRCFEPNITSQPMSNQTTRPSPTSTTSTPSTTASAITAVRKTTTKLISPSSTKPVLSTTERGDVSTRSITTAPDPSGNALQVILTVGCVAGSAVAVGVILLGVFCYRRKKRRDKRTMTNETSSIQRDDKQNDVILSMENELYCSADEMSKSSKVNQGESSEGTEMDEKKTSSVIASNGDVYAVVDRSLKISVI